MAEQKYDVIVIGGGPGGYAAAFMAADLGMQAALVDPEENPGGVCLYRGCIPSKALLHVVKLKQEALEASEFGLSFDEPDINVKKVREWKNSVVQKLVGGLGQLSKKRKVEHIRGVAKFTDANTLEVEHDGKSQEVSFEHAIIATGSEPASIPGLEFSKNIMSSASALDLPDVPDSLLVVGAGYIGLEIGSVYAGMGSKVSVVEMTDMLMPGADRDLVDVFAKRNKELFEEIMLETKVAEISGKRKLKVKLEGKHEGEYKFDKVLIAIGRKPRTKNLGLENTQVETDDKGFIKVNEQRQTAESNIYAIGDVSGEPMLAHKASHEGKIAAEAIAGGKVAYEPKAIPAVVYTDPEIAWCGITENEAKAQDIPIKVVKFPWAASGRAATLGRSDGLTKLIFDPDTERILGVGIAGKNAGDLIPEAVLAVEMAAVAKDFSLSIHPHPTLSETIMEAADVLYGQATHIYRPKRKKK
ncbi:dihydrolipoamide dehydrogenase [Catalinimonas alkaloidigena]|uniref:dihydrolipoyl dehydrogenase n=1 Tax=Catalinimonas alkaloidigena TaxID=1075417 RepID=UPI00240697DB|nr:dihydrolipoyl dehydrogenase [Catalinimonas alkaloidigena]MDF9797440.1 dihydrolipoamide dehydrogenase [Catalinimonas alkaloidigena]